MVKEPVRQMSELLFCPECNCQRVFVSTGAVCPNGHGRIHPTTRRGLKKVRNAIERWNSFVQLPVAQLASTKPTRWRVGNEVYRRCSKDDREIVARFNDKKLYLTTQPEPPKAT